MKRRLFVIAGAMWLASAGLSVVSAKGPQALPSTPPTDSAHYSGVVKQYCVTCHNDRLKTAGLSLEKLDLANVSAGAEAWERVVRKLRRGAMPPQGVRRPDQATNDGLIAWLETEIDQ